ncbi:MAG: DUF2238 domain-containing protein [Balneolaceae bacterium]|nr:DUF2238 domain-containing protein [Balneolaceae bacterium]
MNVLSTLGKVSRDRLLLVLGGLLLAEFLLLAIAPHDRADWLLENILVFLAVPVLYATWRWFPLSRISYLLIFAFLFLHEIGAHYTYAQVPYDAWLRSAFGFSLNEAMGWERNHFDRMVHFSYGLLLAYPVRELYCRVALTRGFWSYFFPLDLVMASSMVFELLEWGVAMVFGGELGMAYLGTQGDVWDAHKDMALASLGALLAMGITAGLNLAIQDDFREEWRESLRPDQSGPLGEEEIGRLIRRRGKAGKK